MVAERDAKSVSVEDTYDVDLTDRGQVQAEVARLAGRCVRRLRAAGRSGRTVVVKVRSYDFSTLTRSETLRGPTDDLGVVQGAAARLLAGIDTTAGVRLLGVGVSGLADFTQEDLFAQWSEEETVAEAARDEAASQPARWERHPAEPRAWRPGQDVVHEECGRGWVQGSGLGRVTVRFEGPDTPPGRVRTFDAKTPALQPAAWQWPMPGQGPLTRSEAGPAAQG